MGSIEVNKEFFINGNKVKIISGAVHYFRIVPEYWRDTLLDLKAMGCNTVETYVPWNLHEPYQGKYDFSDQAEIIAIGNDESLATGIYSYEMGEVKTGALIVIEEETILNEYARTGIYLDSLVTSQLLIPPSKQTEYQTCACARE